MARGGSKSGVAWDPSAALTVAEAAGRAGVSEAALRRRIQAGEILHEVGRRGGREVQLVRLVDLLDAYPDLLQPAARPAPGSSPGSTPGPLEAPLPAAAPEPPEVEGTARAGSAPSGEPPPARDAQPGRPDDERLASIQALNEVLRREVAHLEGQRGDLRELCTDLRERLAALERERQAAGAAWLLAERRFLALEARPAQPSPRGVRRRGVLVGIGAAVLLGAFGALAWRTAGSQRELQGLRATIDRALGAAEGDRARWMEDLEHRRREREELAGDLAGAREEERAERSVLAQRLERLAARSEELARTLEAERAAAEAERTRLAQALAASGERAAAMQRSLEDERRAAEQLQRALSATSLTTEGLRAEWEARAGSLQERAGRLEADLARLESERGREREAARRRAVEWTQRFAAGLLGMQYPRRVDPAVGRAPAPGRPAGGTR